MKDPVYRLSETTVLIARRLEAGLFCGLALIFAVIAFWLTTSFSITWLIVGLDIFLGVCAAQLFVKACTIYSTSQRPERPDERERYLQSRSLHIPGIKREARRPEQG